MTRTIADSSVWIDYFAGRQSAEAGALDVLIETHAVSVADLVVMEVLRGVSDDLAHARMKSRFQSVPILGVAQTGVIWRATENYRFLRKRGYTIRSVVDCIIATYCIDNGFQLLHNDRDFRPFEEHLGLQVLKP